MPRLAISGEDKLSCDKRVAEFEGEYDVLTKEKYSSENYISLKENMLLQYDLCHNNKGYYVLLSKVYMANNDNDLALRFSKKAIALSPDDPFVNDLLGSIFIVTYNFAEGLPYIRRATELSPDNINFLYNYCSSLELAKKYKDAINVCTDVIISKEFVGDAYYVRGRAYKGLGIIDKSKDDFHTAKKFGVDLSHFYSDEHLGIKPQ